MEKVLVWLLYSFPLRLLLLKQPVQWLAAQ